MTTTPGAEPPPGPPVRRRGPRRDALDNKARLLTAAGEVFARLGPSAGLEDIARHAGLGVGTAYRHLGSREAALYEVMSARILELTAIADRAALIEDPWDAVTSYLRELADHVARDRGMMSLMGGDGVSVDQGERLRSLIEPRTVALLDRAKATGQLRADFVDTDVPLLLACVDRVAADTGAVAPDAWRRVLQIALDGLRNVPGTTALTSRPLTARQVAQMASASRRPNP